MTLLVDASALVTAAQPLADINRHAVSRLAELVAHGDLAEHGDVLVRPRALRWLELRQLAGHRVVLWTESDALRVPFADAWSVVGGFSFISAPTLDEAYRALGVPLVVVTKRRAPSLHLRAQKRAIMTNVLGFDHRVAESIDRRTRRTV